MHYTKQIGSFDAFHEVVSAHYYGHVLYRGVRSTEHKLLPKLARLQNLATRTVEEEEINILRYFQQRASGYLSRSPETELEWLALAQHYGIPTRLLDWTMNPLVAAYFAVEHPHDGHSIVYALQAGNLPFVTGDTKLGEVRGLSRFHPRHVTPRITAQAGLFTISSDPSQEHTVPQRTGRLIIEESFRTEFKEMLFRYGIHRASLFPGLDDLAAHLTWLRKGNLFSWHQ